jgi:NMD protein affecting ribosome stability and mRNA decay
MGTTTDSAGGHGARRDRFVQEYQHDSYKLPGKMKEPTVCPKCRAVYHKGRWIWSAPPADAHETLCPACHRIQDKYPKGFLTLKGTFPRQEHEQIMGVVKNTEDKENKEHPLARIMAIEEKPEGVVVSATDTHLPRAIGEALKHAYHGELTVKYDQDEEFVRVTWTR